MSITIGVFDSGVGGEGVANAIAAALPTDRIILRQDTKNLPYGTKSPELLLTLVVPILQELVQAGSQVIVVACNTVSTTIIDKLREKIAVPLVATEPMIKPARLLTKSNVIAVCATPTTLASKRYAWLKETYAKGITVLEPDCSGWSMLIETKQMDVQKIQQEIEDVLDKQADVIVLGCTHYHWIEKDIKAVAKHHAQVIQPEQALIKQLKRVIEKL